MKVILAQDLLKVNSDLAQENRRLFDRERVAVINLIGSLGAGKTSVLEQTLPLLRGKVSVGVIEGDISTIRDA